MIRSVYIWYLLALMIDPGDDILTERSLKPGSVLKRNRIHTYYIINNKFLTLTSRQKSVKKFKKGCTKWHHLQPHFSKSFSFWGRHIPLQTPSWRRLTRRDGCFAAIFVAGNVTLLAWKKKKNKTTFFQAVITMSEGISQVFLNSGVVCNSFTVHTWHGSRWRIMNLSMLWIELFYI